MVERYPIALDPFTDIVAVHWPTDKECPIKLDFVNNKYRVLKEDMTTTYFLHLDDVIQYRHHLGADVDPVPWRSSAGLALFNPGEIDEDDYKYNQAHIIGRARELIFKLGYTITIEYELFDVISAIGGLNFGAKVRPDPTYLLDCPNAYDAGFVIMQSDHMMSHTDPGGILYGGWNGYEESDKWVIFSVNDEGHVLWTRNKNYQYSDGGTGYVNGQVSSVQHIPEAAKQVYGYTIPELPGEEFADSPVWSGDLPFGHSWIEFMPFTTEWEEPTATVGAFDDSRGGPEYRVPAGTVVGSSLYDAAPSPYGINRISVTIDHDHLAQSINGGPVQKVVAPASVYAVPRDPAHDDGEWTTMRGFAHIRCIWICPKTRPDTDLPKLSKVAPLKPW